jgi:hypothetical protein
MELRAEEERKRKRGGVTGCGEDFVKITKNIFMSTGY